MDEIKDIEWAVVTGASAGIGEAFARELAKRGVNLILAARRIDRLERLAGELATEVRPVQADLSSQAGRDRLWQEVESLPDGLDLLINNAGFGLEGNFGDLDWARQQEMIQVNVMALADLSHRFVGHRRPRGGGSLINVASVVAFRPVPRMAVYSATKTFVVYLSRALADETRSSGMRVLSLCPGPVPTEFQQVAGHELNRSMELVAVSAEQVVREGLAALSNNEQVRVPGLAMKLAKVALQLMPVSLSSRLRDGIGRKTPGG